MNQNYLDFEQPIAELQSRLDSLRLLGNDNELNINDEIANLQAKNVQLTKNIFAKLTAAQISQVSRHPNRPYTLDYIERIFTDFDELHGDRHFGDDKAVVCGIARLDNVPVVVIGHQKGRSTSEKVVRNFGMPRPEGYRKALRIMQTAARFKLPIFTFIDTPGAYPGIDAEERGQSEAIATNLMHMSDMRTPIIATVIGEGGSGGALAVGVGDQLNILQYSTYSVISPEGCASILWKDAAHAGDAANAMGITATRLHELGLVDQIIEEPLGGAHRDMDAIAATLKQTLAQQMYSFQQMELDGLLARRYQRLMSYGITS